MSRPRISIDEKRIRKTVYMMNKKWCCEVCDNRDYKLAGKTLHVRTQKHQINILKKIN